MFNKDACVVSITASPINSSEHQQHIQDVESLLQKDKAELKNLVVRNMQHQQHKLQRKVLMLRVTNDFTGVILQEHATPFVGKVII